MSFEEELQGLINKASMENGSDTPDFILATYLWDCLRAFELATRRRENWYGVKADPEGATRDPTDSP